MWPHIFIYKYINIYNISSNVLCMYDVMCTHSCTAMSIVPVPGGGGGGSGRNKLILNTLKKN